MKLKSPLSSKKHLIAEWFRNEKRPYEKRRTINVKKILWSCLGLTGILMLFILFAPVPEKTPESTDPKSNYPESGNQKNQTRDGERMNSPGDPAFGMSQPQMYGSASMSSRNRNANQVIRRSAQNSDSSGMIPMGSAIGARLVNAVLSANSASPVIALIEESNSQIPSGSKAIGTATFDEQVKRISIHFHTIVYPDGEQRGVQGIAMMPDGSAGLDGDYSSGEGKRQIGRFLGYFISGMAEGMKEKSSAGGMMGGAYEPGSVKNGVLNGVSRSAEDQAQEFSESMTNQHPTMSLPSGMDFVFYFEREFNP